MYGMSQILAKKNCNDPAGSALLNHRLGMAAGAWCLSWLPKSVCIRNDSPLMARQCSCLFDVIDHDHDQFDIDDPLSDEQLTLSATSHLTLQNEIMFDQATITSISGGNFINVNKTSTAEEGV